MPNPPRLHYFKVMNYPTPSLLKCPELSHAFTTEIPWTPPHAFTIEMDWTLLNISPNKSFFKFFVINFVTTVSKLLYKHYLLCNPVNSSNYWSGCTIVKDAIFLMHWVKWCWILTKEFISTGKKLAKIGKNKTKISCKIHCLNSRERSRWNCCFSLSLFSFI